MAQIVVRNLDEGVKQRLQRRAARHGRSMEAEAREILGAATAEEVVSGGSLAHRISAHFKEIGESLEIEEQRGQSAKPADFDE